MGKASINSGKTWERRVANMVEDATGVEANRELEEVRRGNIGDINTTLPLVIQCKNMRQPSVWKALDEAEEAAHGSGQIPMAFIRKKGGPGGHPPVREAVLINVSDFLPMLSAWWVLQGGEGVGT